MASISSPERGVFVGREPEIDILRASVEDALAGHGRLVFLVGEPGIGKTRTCEEVAAYARGRGAHVLWSRCYEGEGAPAFWPWVQVIRSVTRALDQEGLRTLLGPGAVDVAQVVPELRARLPDLPAPAGIEAAPARFRVFDSITRCIENWAQRAPLVVIIDDLQGADPSSLLLLQFVMRQLRGMPVLFVGTCRDRALHGDKPLVETFAEALRVPGTERLTLRGLSASDVARFVELTTGVPPGAALVTALHQHTEGNPLFVAEFVRVLMAEGRLQAGTDGPILGTNLPAGVKAVIDRRVAPLSAACRAALLIAAVIGREFRLNVLAGALAEDDGPPPAGALEEAVAARVVEPLDTTGRYRFAHALIRETLYEELSPLRRMELHQLVGRALERLPDADDYLAELAYHFSETGCDGDRTKAVTYARRAGDRALALLAYEEAARLYQLALQALQHAAPIDEGARCELLLSVADARRRAGQRLLARQTYQQAAEIARKLRRPDAFARAALGDAIEGFVAGTTNEALIRLLEEAFGVLGEQDSVLKATVTAQLAIALAADGTAQWDRSAQLSEQAVAIARRVGNATALAEALLGRHWVLGSSPNMEERLAVSTEALRVAADTGDPGLVMSCRELRVRDLLELGDIDALNREIEAQVRDAQRLRQPVWLGQATHLRAVRALLAGRLDECERLAQEGFAIGQHVNLEGGLQLVGAQLFQVRREQGRLGELEPGVRANADRYAAAVGFRCALAYVLAELNRQVEARTEFERLAADDFAALRKGAANLNVAFLAQVCAFLGDAQRAQSLYEFLRPHDGRNIVTPFSFICFGSASHPLGLLAATMQRWDEAARHFEDALRMYRKMGAPLFMARTQFEYARTLLGRDEPGDHEKVHELLAQALTTARQLGMKILEEEISGLLGIIQGSAVSRQQSEMTDPQPETNVFRKEGDYWTITHDGVVVRLKDSKGLQYIAYLLHHPGQQVHALELVQAVSGDARPVAANERLATTSPPLLDAQTRVAYRHRLEGLRETLAEAEGLNDRGRAARAREEIEALGEQLAAVVGLGGRDRLAAAAAERARLAVTKGIKSAIQKLRAANPTLARHLAIAITTGSLCGYAPDPDAVVSWLF